MSYTDRSQTLITLATSGNEADWYVSRLAEPTILEMLRQLTKEFMDWGICTFANLQSALNYGSHDFHAETH